jgi:hypothetical protein
MRLRAILLAATSAAAIFAAPLSADAAPSRLDTAITDGGLFDTNPTLAFQRVRDAGAGYARLYVSWRDIVPLGATKPAGFNASNPTDPGYDWALLDQKVQAAVAEGVAPILMAYNTPEWAERGNEGPPGTRDPDPDEVGNFAEAMARRYSGTLPGLPRVRYFQLWNEPNLYRYLMPQFDTPFNQNVQPGDAVLSTGVYRNMTNAFARAVHGVKGDNVVLAGGLAPFGQSAATRHGVAPLQFMRNLFCLNGDNKPKSNCKPIHFDVWTHHPYTEGGPNHSALAPTSVSIGDLPEMKKVLNAALRAHRVKSREHVRFWVTEFSWETKPTDPQGVPMKLHSRWVSEALYRMWQSGVSLVTWFKLRDELDASRSEFKFQSGLYFACSNGPSCDKPKRSFTAFRFPFVAFKAGPHVRVWGRTPAGVRGRVLVEQRRPNGHWKRLKRLRTNRHGLFKKRLKRSGRGPVRATLVGAAKDRSLPFELKPTKDMSVTIFGE